MQFSEDLIPRAEISASTRGLWLSGCLLLFAGILSMCLTVYCPLTVKAGCLRRGKSDLCVKCISGIRMCQKLADLLVSDLTVCFVVRCLNHVINN